MATLAISFTVPDAHATQIRNDFCDYHGYKVNIPDPANPGQTIPNPQSRTDFIKQKVGEFIKDSVRAFRANADAETARNAALNTVNTNIVLT